MSISDNIKSLRTLHGNRVKPASNSPKQYRDRQKQYFADESTSFIKEYAKYSSDFVKARMQGLFPDNFERFRTVYMRLSDVVKPSAAITRHFDDYKQYLVDDPAIDYVPSLRNRLYADTGIGFSLAGRTIWLCRCRESH